MTTSQELHPRMAEVTAALEAAQQEMHALLATVPEGRRNDLPADGGWSVAQIVEHLALVEDGAGRVISKLIKQVGETAETESTPIAPSLERFQVWDPSRRLEAPDMVAPGGTISFAEALDRQCTARARMIDALVGASGRALGTATWVHARLGPLDGYQWALFIAQHQRRHLLQMAAVSSSLSS